MGGLEKRPGRPVLPVDRLVNLTDAMFAIIMTLLVLTINVPSVTGGQVPEMLRAELENLTPTFVSYVLSFGILGFNWIGHHSVYFYIKRANAMLIWLNMAYLLLLAVVPFTTDLFGEYAGQRIAGILYIGNIFLVAILLLAQWLYAVIDHRLVDSDLDPYLIRDQTIHRIIGPIGFGIAFIFAFFSISLAIITMIATGIAHVFVRKINERMVPLGDEGIDQQDINLSR